MARPRDGETFWYNYDLEIEVVSDNYSYSVYKCVQCETIINSYSKIGDHVCTQCIYCNYWHEGTSSVCSEIEGDCWDNLAWEFWQENCVEA